MRKSCDIVLSFILNSLVNGGPNFYILCSVILPSWPLQLVLKKQNLYLGKAKKCYLF